MSHEATPLSPGERESAEGSLPRTVCGEFSRLILWAGQKHGRHPLASDQRRSGPMTYDLARATRPRDQRAGGSRATASRMTPTEKAAGGLFTEQGEAAGWPSLRRSASLALKVGSNFVQEGPPYDSRGETLHGVSPRSLIANHG